MPKVPRSTRLSLSDLLSKAKQIAQEVQLIKLEIVEQPQQYWKKRSINCLKQKWCPAIQGRSGKQRHYISIKVRVIINYLIHYLEGDYI